MKKLLLLVLLTMPFFALGHSLQVGEAVVTQPYNWNYWSLGVGMGGYYGSAARIDLNLRPGAVPSVVSSVQADEKVISVVPVLEFEKSWRLSEKITVSWVDLFGGTIGYLVRPGVRLFLSTHLPYLFIVQRMAFPLPGFGVDAFLASDTMLRIKAGCAWHKVAGLTPSLGVSIKKIF